MMGSPGASGRHSNSGPTVRDVEERNYFEAGDGMSCGLSGRHNSGQRKGKHRCSRDLPGLCVAKKSTRMEPGNWSLVTREEEVGDEIREQGNLQFCIGRV